MQNLSKGRSAALLITVAALFTTNKSSIGTMQAQTKPCEAKSEYVFHGAGNPYLPLWEHLPDGEPRVFEDPDNPGKFRTYIIGSHDLRFNSYCGPDIRMWSAPVEDLSSWRDEGPIFTYNIDNQWDVMYAPDLVEVKENGKKVYYLYPHSRGRGRISLIAKSTRPDGPYTVVNATEDGRKALPESILGFDPSVFIENITDPKDPDYNIGFRAYGFWGFQHSTAAQLDQKAMYAKRPGTEVVDPFIPASRRYGVPFDPEGTVFPALYKGQKPGDFNFFEASSIRQVGNKYVMVFSGYSGPEYGLGSTNSALRYAFGDSPLGPWRSGGVLVDSRGVVLNEDGTKLVETNSAHNTHGSLQEINGQWYVFYHRPPRGFGFARQAMVAPVKIEWDKKSVADGGIVTIQGYDPYAKDNVWKAKDSKGHVYNGAEVTSEGFHIFGLDPYAYYSAGYACYMSNHRHMQDSWDWWDNNMNISSIKNKEIVGFKYFGFGGLEKDTKGIKAFSGAQKGNNTAINVFLTPQTDNAFKINVMIDGPWDNKTWKGKKIATINVPAGSAKTASKFTADVAKYVEGLKGKHAIYLVAEGNDDTELFTLHGIGFSSNTKSIERPVPPTINIEIDGEKLNMPSTPIRSTEQNGYCDVKHYAIEYNAKPDTKISNISVTSSDPSVKVVVEPIVDGVIKVIATYNELDKVYLIRVNQ
ncbi:MAG: hypothetical protein J5805_00980 [Bacteroidaceae bacterium]|nr:hypothetical protein [Bacteroidaceae bacterium]